MKIIPLHPRLGFKFSNHHYYDTAALRLKSGTNFSDFRDVLHTGIVLKIAYVDKTFHVLRTGDDIARAHNIVRKKDSTSQNALCIRCTHRMFRKNRLKIKSGNVRDDPSDIRVHTRHITRPRKGVATIVAGVVFVRRTMCTRLAARYTQCEHNNNVT